MTIKELRCSECNKQLLKCSDGCIEIEVKCPRCKETNEFAIVKDITIITKQFVGAKVIKPKL